jgi:hypothetical protein
MKGRVDKSMGIVTTRIAEALDRQTSIFFFTNLIELAQACLSVDNGM